MSLFNDKEKKRIEAWRKKEDAKKLRQKKLDKIAAKKFLNLFFLIQGTYDLVRLHNRVELMILLSKGAMDIVGKDERVMAYFNEPLTVRNYDLIGYIAEVKRLQDKMDKIKEMTIK